jgi:hypothetical protein
MGHGTLHHLALVLILPSAAALLVAWLLLDRFALGPSTLSDAAGFAYHA